MIAELIGTVGLIALMVAALAVFAKINSIAEKRLRHQEERLLERRSEQDLDRLLRAAELADKCGPGSMAEENLKLELAAFKRAEAARREQDKEYYF